MADLLSTERQDAEYKRFLERGEVRLQGCSSCGHLRHPAQWICPECLSENYEWKAINGQGCVETFVWYIQPVDPRFTEVPYNVALVKLDAGPRVIGNVRTDFETLKVGVAVFPLIEETKHGYVLNFTAGEDTLPDG